MLHPGHMQMLKHCASLGHHVLVGIDSDDRVQQLKGASRPINSQEFRKEMLLNTKWVNDVRIFSSDEQLTSLVNDYKPDYMIVGSDWQNKHVIGSEHAKIVGFFERINEFSTTNIIERIADR